MISLEEERQNNIIRKLVFRVVRKHIAGSTSSAVLNVVRELNDKGFHATVTLLNDHVDDQTKARYNTNAYTQFIRQLSRLHLNSDVSIRPSQIGYGIDSVAMEKNLQDIIDIANNCNQRLWLEDEESLTIEKIMPIYRKFKPKCDTLGVEIIPQPNFTNGNLKRMISNKDILKLRFQAYDKKEKKDKSVKTDRLNLYKEYIDTIMERKASSLTVLEDDPKLINKITAANKDYKKNLIFEIPLGYSNKKLSILQKNKLNLSVYVPYGKDWVPYLINRLAEGRVKNIAVALLNGQKTTVDINVKNSGIKAG